MLADSLRIVKSESQALPYYKISQKNLHKKLAQAGRDVVEQDNAREFPQAWKASMNAILGLIRDAEAHKGRIHTLRTTRDVKTLKTYDGPRIQKHAVYSARVGHDYANQSAVMEKHESGEVQKMGMPAWQRYVSPAIREHKDTGKKYVGFQPLSVKVEFTKGGEIVGKDEIAPFLLASEKQERAEGLPDWMTVGLDTVADFK